MHIKDIAIAYKNTIFLIQKLFMFSFCLDALSSGSQGKSRPWVYVCVCVCVCVHARSCCEHCPALLYRKTQRTQWMWYNLVL